MNQKVELLMSRQEKYAIMYSRYSTKDEYLRSRYWKTPCLTGDIHLIIFTSITGNYTILIPQELSHFDSQGMKLGNFNSS